MKKKILAIVLASSLVLSLGLAFAGPVGASNGNVLYGIIGTHLVTIDETTGDATDVATLSGDTTGLMQDIAFDWQSGVLYGLARTSSTDRTPLLTTIDVCTGEVSIVDTITLTGETVYFAEGLAIDDQGTMYVSMSINGEPPSDYYSETLVTVNPADAVATYVATISGTSATIEDEADALECVDGILYAVDDPGSGPSEVFTINTGTGVATSQGILSAPRFNNIGDMAWNPDSDLLYGFDPGAQGMTYDRYLCTISQPGIATATPIGVIHSVSEFGGTIQGLSWGNACQMEMEVYVDIKPTSCPNPLNLMSNGVLPVAILGTDEFDVNDIDPATVELIGVSPLRWGIEDVATPFDGEVEEGCCLCCSTEGPDGYDDLTLKFDKQEIVEAIGDGVEDGDCIILTLTGELFDGTAIEGGDIVKILKKGPNDNGNGQVAASSNGKGKGK